MLAELTAFLQVMLIDLVLAGDNALVVGLAVAGIAPERRRQAILWGIGCAVVLRIAFAILASRLLDILGLTLAGGVLLLWVCWKMWREIRHARGQSGGADGAAPDAAAAPGKTMAMAIRQIILADISMSLDNVLAVAGAAEGHVRVMVAGLVLSVVLMGIAASLIARLLERYRWIAYVGLAVIAYVALSMIWHGGWEVFRAGSHAAAGI